MSNQLLRLIDSKAVLYGKYHGVTNLKRLRRVVDISKTDSGRFIFDLLSRPSMDIVPKDSSILGTIMTYINELSKNQKIGIVIVLGAVVIASVAGVVTYFFKKSKPEDIQMEEIANIATSNKTFIKFPLEHQKELSTINIIPHNNLTVSDDEVRELIHGLLNVSKISRNKPVIDEIPKQFTSHYYTRSLPPENDRGNLSIISDSSKPIKIQEDDDMEEKKKGSVASKKSIFSSLSEYQRKI